MARWPNPCYKEYNCPHLLHTPHIQMADVKTLVNELRDVSFKAMTCKQSTQWWANVLAVVEAKEKLFAAQAKDNKKPNAPEDPVAALAVSFFTSSQFCNILTLDGRRFPLG